MIKSNTNMEEIGKLVSPRPPEDVIHVTWTDWTDFRRLIRDSMEADSMEAAKITRRIDEKWKKEKPKAIIALMDKLKNVKETLETVHAKSSSESLEDIARLILFDIDKHIEETKEEKIKQLFIFLLAFILFLGKASNPGYQASPERGKIACVNVYLLGNDGAHAYNGNGIPFSRQTNSNEDISLIAVADNYRQEPFVQILPPKPPPRVLLQKPTNQMIALISMEIGSEYVPLALLLGLSKADLDHIKEDNGFAVQRVSAILLKWRDKIERDATIEKLVNAFEKLGINSDIVYNSLKDA